MMPLTVQILKIFERGFGRWPEFSKIKTVRTFKAGDWPRIMLQKTQSFWVSEWGAQREGERNGAGGSRGNRVGLRWAQKTARRRAWTDMVWWWVCESMSGVWEWREENGRKRTWWGLSFGVLFELVWLIHRRGRYMWCGGSIIIGQTILAAVVAYNGQQNKLLLIHPLASQGTSSDN